MTKSDCSASVTESKKPSPSFGGSLSGASPMMMSPVAESEIDSTGVDSWTGFPLTPVAGDDAAGVFQTGSESPPIRPHPPKAVPIRTTAAIVTAGKDWLFWRVRGCEFIDGDDTVARQVGSTDERPVLICPDR